MISRQGYDTIRIAGLLCMLLILASCSPGSGSDRDIEDVDIHTGSDGLEVTFADDSPPDMVLEGEEFPVAFLFHNKGAYNITNGYMNIITESDYVSVQEIEGISPITTTRGTFSLGGKTRGYEEGEKKMVQVDLLAQGLSKMEETHTIVISNNVCYRYHTTFGEPICLDPDTNDLSGKEKSCEMSSLSSSGQGAPVAVTTVKPDFRGTQGERTPIFTVTIENLGQGQVINASKAKEACSSSTIRNDDFNVVTIEKAFLSDEPLTCKPRVLTLQDGSATTRCVMDRALEGGRDAFTTILRLELDYGYTLSVSDTLEIRRYAD